MTQGTRGDGYIAPYGYSRTVPAPEKTRGPGAGAPGGIPKGGALGAGVLGAAAPVGVQGGWPPGQGSKGRRPLAGSRGAAPLAGVQGAAPPGVRGDHETSRTNADGGPQPSPPQHELIPLSAKQKDPTETGRVLFLRD